ncbi:hypothetical protein GRI99_09355 [Altererythrobacter buctensis]|uniref:Uncharacterized protein n=2 Tax=Alteraurantiacibacter buctensis TaxID=1503981 RepID=A0A844Z1R0_9SPHN|nr:hypothetical protein [Alteraurantiacibacter buctensis]
MRNMFGPALLVGALMLPVSARALSVNGLKDQGVDHIYGSYARSGDCSREPRVTISDAGMAFTSSGRTVQVTRLEYAVSFFGMSYEGISLAFFPFPQSRSDMGPVLLYANYDEKPGALLIEANAEPGQRLDPFHASLAGEYQLCAGTGSTAAPATPASTAAPAPVAGTPLEWTNLAALVGRYPGAYSEDNIDLFDKGTIAAALRAALGAKMPVLEANLSAVTPLQSEGGLYYIMGNAPHRGGEDQAYVTIDPVKRAVQVGLWEQGKLTVYAPASGRLPEPREVRDMLARSPGESANAAPGTPWEVLPVSGRVPVAYVEAAASPSIISLTLYCENGRPYMAMLLNKPANGARSTMTWNFAGRLVNIPVQRANNAGTYWVGGITGTQLVPLLMTQRDMVYLRIDGRLEGEASLADAPATVRATLRQCVRL